MFQGTAHRNPDSMINLLERFSLTHTQITQLHAELKGAVPEGQAFNAKVELKLSPREVETPGTESEMPSYQVTARLICRGFRSREESSEPLFLVEMVLQAVYRQVAGEPVDAETFTQNHTSLTRQLYPIIHHQLKPIFKQFGLDQVKLPYDLFNPASKAGASAGQAGRQVH